MLDSVIIYHGVTHMNIQNQSYVLLWSEKDHCFDVRSLEHAIVEAAKDFFDHLDPDYVPIAIASTEAEANKRSYEFARKRKLVFDEFTFKWQDT